MLMDTPKTRTWIGYAMTAAVMVYTSRQLIAAGYAELGALVMFFAVICGGAAGVHVVYWLIYNVIANFRHIIMARAETERVLVMRVIAQLNDAQLHYLETIDPTVITIPGSAGPVNYLLRISGAEIPYGFVREFFDQSQGAYLVPVGSYAEGTKQRTWAVALTNHLVRQGFAERAAGNHSARWTQRAEAARWVNLDRLSEMIEE